MDIHSYIKEAKFYKRLENNLVQCNLCPHRCIIKPGQRGFCGVRENRNGKLYTLNYGFVTALNIDPIEKKPLFHFYPGSPIVSISTVGCNFRCPWCQNYSISQARPEEVYGEFMTPQQVVSYALSCGVPFIAYTYNEPIIWYEFVLDTARIAKKHNIKNVLVTNGYINLDPLDELLKYIDAANVDIKSFNIETYKKYIKGSLEAVLQATKEMHDKGIHVEITHLVIPGINDNVEEFRKLVKWHLDNLGPDVPLHISRFVPMYKFIDREETPIEILEKFWKIARDEGLYYVYMGNVPGHKGEYTYCPSCKKPVIKRIGFYITGWYLTEDNRCNFCGEKIAIVGKRWKEKGGFIYL